SQTQEPINQQQKSPAAGYQQETGQTSQALPTPENSQEHTTPAGNGEQAEKAGQEPSGMIGDAANESAKEQLEQMKKEEQEKEQSIGGSGANQDTGGLQGGTSQPHSRTPGGD
ncbi:MAG TPA: hypothetical protein VEU33_14220, partial [Archangium sp.]|nr:hypothetical protein [Archangium sp.]